jgi:hypothetical protein
VLHQIRSGFRAVDIQDVYGTINVTSDLEVALGELSSALDFVDSSKPLSIPGNIRVGLTLRNYALTAQHDVRMSLRNSRKNALSRY